MKNRTQLKTNEATYLEYDFINNLGRAYRITLTANSIVTIYDRESDSCYFYEFPERFRSDEQRDLKKFIMGMSEIYFIKKFFKPEDYEEDYDEDTEIVTRTNELNAFAKMIIGVFFGLFIPYLKIEGNVDEEKNFSYDNEIIMNTTELPRDKTVFLDDLKWSISRSKNRLCIKHLDDVNFTWIDDFDFETYDEYDDPNQKNNYMKKVMENHLRDKGYVVLA